MDDRNWERWDIVTTRQYLMAIGFVEGSAFNSIDAVRVINFSF